MIKWLQDSYNGLYKVLLEPVTPKRVTVGALIAGVLIGLIWAYAIAPVVYYDADPNTLHQSWQDEWVKLLADRRAAANSNVDNEITLLLQEVDDPVGIIDRLIVEQPAYAARLQEIRPLATTAQPVAALAPQPSILGSILPFIVAPLIAALIFVIAAWLWRLFIFPNLFEPMLRARREGGSGAGDTAIQDLRAVQDQKRAAETTLKTQFETSNYGKPLMQRMSAYIAGRGQFDDSFSIEDENEKFLGECGAGISEYIGTGSQNVTAVEVWLFDKDDFVRTLTGVFATEHAYNDPAIRSKLDPKGPVTIIEPGAVVVLETASLRLQATVKEVTYGSGPLPPNSYVEKLTVELAAWRKQGASAPAPSPVAVPAPVISAPAPIASTPSFAPTLPPPPPITAAPQVTAPPTGGGFAPLRPLSPPPQAPLAPPPVRPPTLDDDPFGGTGDFRPIR